VVPNGGYSTLCVLGITFPFHGFGEHKYFSVGMGPRGLNSKGEAGDAGTEDKEVCLNTHDVRRGNG
jgi:hypothetical protein